MTSEPGASATVDYLNWNDKLAAYFFNSEMADRPVYLYANEDVISQVAISLGAPPEQFVSAVTKGPDWVKHGELCQRALQTMKGWRKLSLPYPPYIGYLSLFVFAACAEGDFAPHAYYPRLRRLLGLPERGALPSFDRMYELWDDLETWANKDKDCTLGIFTARITGNWIHVGLPIAQTILTEQERKALPRIFAQAGLDPTSTPPAEALARALRTYGPKELQRRTLNLLNSRGEREIYDVLLDIVADELLDWDGHVDQAVYSDADSVRSFAIARLCVALDPVANQATCRMRLKLNRDFPEDGLILNLQFPISVFVCEESVDRWSTHLRYVDDVPLDSATLDWTHGIVLREDRLRWQFKLPGRTARVLIEGSSEALPDLVETQALPRSRPFYLLYHEQESARLSSWFKDDCRGVKELGHLRGLPSSWKIASIREAIRDSIRNDIPSLSFSNGIRIRYVGGLRRSAGNTFFSFAPPSIIIDGKDGSEQILCNDQLLIPSDTDAGLYELPRPLQIDTKILIEVKTGSSLLRRTSIYLAADIPWKKPTLTQMFNRWGMPLESIDDGTTAISGANVIGTLPSTGHFRKALSLVVPTDTTTNTRVYYVGRIVGEIVSWPTESLPDDWTPIWAISLRRRGQAIFCGEDPATSTPMRSDKYSREKCKLWKEILWHDREKIMPPKQRSLVKLWRTFVETARHA